MAFNEGCIMSINPRQDQEQQHTRPSGCFLTALRSQWHSHQGLFFLLRTQMSRFTLWLCLKKVSGIFQNSKVHLTNITQTGPF